MNIRTIVEEGGVIQRIQFIRSDEYGETSIETWVQRVCHDERWGWTWGIKINGLPVYESPSEAFPNVASAKRRAVKDTLWFLGRLGSVGREFRKNADIKW